MRDNNCSESWNNKAVICNDLLRFEEAITCCDNALYIKPDYVEAYLHKGNGLFFLKQYEDALACFDKVIFLKPETIVAYGNKALTLSELKRLDEAIIFYEKALHLMPNIEWIYGDLIASKMRVCDWSNYDIQIEKLKKRINFDEKVIVPFPLLSLIDDPLLHKKNAEIYYKNKYPVIRELGNILKRPKKKKIRIGYFSPDFGNHAVSLLTAELFEIHNRELFEVIAICLDEKSSADVMRIRLKKAFDKFIETKNLNDCEIAKLSRELEIDIAIDLAGFTKNSRTGIFSY
jgi:predicted O-linked N-acetylglucosamine transferase (SPINDLY family)